MKGLLEQELSNREMHPSEESDDCGEQTIKLTRITTSGKQGEYVHLGDNTFLKSDMMYAFGGDFNPGAHVAPKLRLGNSSPMGLFAFATTTLILSFINAGTRNVHNSNIVLGCAVFYGGVLQIIAGIWELIVENTFGATVFASYGGFWLSYACISINAFDIAGSYESDAEFANAVGLYLLAWALVTAMFTMCTLRSTVAMFSLLFFLTLTFILLAGAQFSSANGSSAATSLSTAAGVIGCITAAFAYYNAMAGLLNWENSWISVRPIYMPGAIRPPSYSKSKEA
ncbi:Ady2 protein [Starmerella bacillaris]|uniref:Ady2 protein n=1 Tax=Starmerella bacillaris TaxID=1247836 RepID=A0AAV5RD76_STABA|nr:Ady2 protein [Starmerella bacillaris]